MRTFKKGIKNFEVKVDLQNGALRFKEKKLIIDVLVSSHSRLYSLLSHGNSPQGLPCPFLSGFAFGGLGFYKLEVHGALMSSLEFSSLWVVAKLLCSCLCLFDAINKLHAMDDIIYSDYFIGK